ncbi:alkaline phosphatase [Novosphingobium sp. PC22D]|uniref:alkaline phosphatase family protein n=1 Tax=Novosphingobium sp. PC22D TaxID=1962403 RepID=UPI000BFAE103|nr:alkaline phosphatase family protein [Novosphingobium sp. PC22D]PEQ14729.1 alkaline phosphatase [Novosphingobium sp. PC22D]
MRPVFAPFALALALAGAAPALAQEAAPAPPAATAAEAAPQGPPRLIVAISVDQFAADLFAQYREHFSQGFARLLTGAVFPSGYQSHAATETCPGHSTILTGAHPARTGIIANNWYVPGLGREEKRVYCAEDETDPASSSREPVVSPDHLKVPTLGDLMKRANPRAKNVAVSAKDRAAVMMSGHTADAAYWLGTKGFTTYADRQVSPAALAVNSQIGALVASGAPALPMPAWCAGVDRAVPIKDFTIGTFRFPLAAGDAKGFGRSPRVDAATGDLAVRLVDEQGLGKDDVADVLSVSFSATDYVGHAYGHDGVEMCIQLAQLDATIGTLFAALDERGIDYAVVLTADHGGIDAPERLRLHAYPGAQRLDPALGADALSAAVTQATGVAAKSGPLFYGAGGSGDVWIADGLKMKDREKALAKLIELLKANPQVAAVYTKDELAAMPVPEGAPQDWTMAEKVRASFDPERSGDVLMMTRRGVVPGDPSPSYTTTHGSPWDYDRRVPILFWRKGLAGFEQPDPVETVDIAPTLAALVGLSEPEGAWDGRCLDIDGGSGDTCAP